MHFKSLPKEKHAHRAKPGRLRNRTDGFECDAHHHHHLEDAPDEDLQLLAAIGKASNVMSGNMHVLSNSHPYTPIQASLGCGLDGKTGGGDAVFTQSISQSVIEPLVFVRWLVCVFVCAFLDSNACLITRSIYQLEEAEGSTQRSAARQCVFLVRSSSFRVTSELGSMRQALGGALLENKQI